MTELNTKSILTIITIIVFLIIIFKMLIVGNIEILTSVNTLQGGSP